ncbi:MAG TPA: SRPBCC family protein [Acidimicrobiales bacterium]|jgi:uncharacterized protein YndB with AHSA1/START domain
MILLDEFHGHDAVRLISPPEVVFAALVDVARLPDWNARVHHVIEDPGRPLAEGSEWVVQMRASGGRWPSRSRAVIVDPVSGRFEHESRSDDGNPSWGSWSWRVVPVEDGSELAVTWAIHPRTWGRRLVGARIRRPALVKEVRTSLTGLDAHLRAGAADGALVPEDEAGPK